MKILVAILYIYVLLYIFIFISICYIFRHYGTNRAPMNLGFDAAWLEVNKGFARELEHWIRDTLADHSDVYFVTQIQVIYFSDQTSPPNIIRF